MADRIETLAAKIRDPDVPRSVRYSAHRMVVIGQRLLEAKSDEAIPRGERMRWIEQEAGIPSVTAFRYMRLAMLVSEGLITVGDIAVRGQHGAVKLAKAR